MEVVGALLLVLWYVVAIIQSILAYGTAYRYTQRGGDNGVALWGWMLAFGLAALIPGLGYYLWRKSKEQEC